MSMPAGDPHIRLATARGARVAAWLGGLVTLGTIFVLGTLTPGHDMVNGYISTIGVPGEPYTNWYVAGGGISAALNLAFLFVLSREHPQQALLASALALLASFFVLHFTAAAFFPCAADCDWSTLGSRVHYAMGFAAFVSFAVGTIVFTVAAARRPHWPRLAILRGATVVFVAAAVGLLIADLTRTYHGVAERSVAVALVLWLAVLAATTWPTRST